MLLELRAYSHRDPISLVVERANCSSAPPNSDEEQPEHHCPVHPATGYFTAAAASSHSASAKRRDIRTVVR